jgi:hypothetical protein
MTAWDASSEVGYLRFRKSIKLGPGVRLNVGKRGAGVSAGVRGARYSVHSSGRRTASVGIPGTGVGYVSSRSGMRSGTERPQDSGDAPDQGSKKPGLFAPKYEKRFAKGVEHYVSGRVDQAIASFREASAADERSRSSADDLMAGLLLLGKGDAAERPHLQGRGESLAAAATITEQRNALLSPLGGRLVEVLLSDGLACELLFDAFQPPADGA